MRQIHYALMLVVSNVLFSVWVAAPTNGTFIASMSVASDRPQTEKSIHYFTMTMPERAGKQFTKLSFSFTEPNQDKTVAPLRFDLASTKAFAGSSAEGQSIGVKDAWVDETGILWVEFDAPVPSKTQLTLALKTLKSSPVATYSYGIAAYPETKLPAVFVGDGSLTISE